MFIDKAKIIIKAGKGGDGKVSFHREKYVAAGGPDGGDGGKGGDIIFVSDSNLSTLLDFKYKRKYTALDGEGGKGGNSSGKNAPDLIIKVPVGTVIYDSLTGLVLHDFKESGDSAVIAKGGGGGFGNKRFATPTRQIPKFAKPGLKGQEREVVLELKQIADAGLIGFPNVGKSTFLSVSSKATPKIADYHFTTLTPNLGVVRLSDGRSFVLADIPGIIEGASQGAGLGHAFLRHIERTRLLIHLIDISGIEGRSPYEDFDIINLELQKYSDKLARREQIIVGNKADLTDEEAKEKFKTYFEGLGYTVFVISAATNCGVTDVLNCAYEKIRSIPEPILYDENELYRDDEFKNEEVPYTVFADEDGVFHVEGPFIMRLMQATNPNDHESMQYFQRALKSRGVFDKLEEAGVKEGDLVKLYEMEFDYVL